MDYISKKNDSQKQLNINKEEKKASAQKKQDHVLAGLKKMMVEAQSTNHELLLLSQSFIDR